MRQAIISEGIVTWRSIRNRSRRFSPLGGPPAVPPHTVLIHTRNPHITVLSSSFSSSKTPTQCQGPLSLFIVGRSASHPHSLASHTFPGLSLSRKLDFIQLPFKMALAANRIPRDSVLTHQTSLCRYHEKQNFSLSTINRIQLSRSGMRHGLLAKRSALLSVGLQCLYGKPFRFISKKVFFLCKSSRANNTEEKECDTTYDDVAGIIGSHTKANKSDLIHSGQGLAGACTYAHEDAKFLNETARSDISLLSCGMTTLEAHARQYVAFLGTEFLKLDARAREDTEIIDHKVKEKAKLLHHLATILKDKAQARLKSAADEHWSDGALKADLHLADFRAKQRAIEDALMALEFAKNIHDKMVNRMYELNKSSLPANNVGGCIKYQKNTEIIDFFPMDVSTDKIAVIQEAYWSMTSALSEADGIDYTDPEELELLITALIDLDALDGKQSASLLAECARSPDVSTRQALANALAKAPSTWALGNAGMGALQRLAKDSSPAIAAAASRAIYKLNKQWEIEEGYGRGKTKQPRI
ncbi:senescence-associated protein AAF, chlorolplastic-like [Prosopis cineraria]|uniref:senescence-associated protein AAF, chlorolplastic-like n=1 Tax=Prosopis cineraria TaxID=364024 RepID=UPI00240EAE4F|nr:senescence-associated protein AAF, chlorolplastic-like [Prosopis cineraria]